MNGDIGGRGNEVVTLAIAGASGTGVAESVKCADDRNLFVVGFTTGSGATYLQLNPFDTKQDSGDTIGWVNEQLITTAMPTVHIGAGSRARVVMGATAVIATGGGAYVYMERRAK